MNLRSFAVVILSGLILFPGCAINPVRTARETWSSPALWTTNRNGESRGELATDQGPSGPCLRLDYELGGPHGWVEFSHTLATNADPSTAVTFSIKADATSKLDLKLVDADGSVFGRTIMLANAFKEWTPVVFCLDQAEYWWGGRDDRFSGLAQFQWAASGQGRGTIWIDGIGLGRPGLLGTFPPAGPVIDPSADLAGTGFLQRRSAEMIPEDPLVLEWLKQVQDVSSPASQLLPSMENNECQTFNNALVAMAFILKGEKDRAERILDFFAKATVRDNQDPTLQNFFYKGEARGFFQAVNLKTEGAVEAYHTSKPTDRWMGDMAWLFIAYDYYQKTYGNERYSPIMGLLKDLLVAWFVDKGNEGFVDHGWRNGDSKLHEGFGHPEGNIDAYAAFRLCGENTKAEKIRTYLDRVLRGNTLPLDQYTWRVQAFGKDYADRLDIPDRDLRYRKTVTMADGRQVVGFYDHADINVTNIWCDGVGQAACAYIAFGDRQRGYFYANQMDGLLIDREINGVRCRTLPYTANAAGGYDWVSPDRGFVSVAAWYIFAKNGFNPMTLERADIVLP